MTEMILIVGSGSGTLGRSVAHEVGQNLAPVVNDLFPDGERHVRIEASLRGEDVFIIQATAGPVGENLLELLLLADAVRRAGAKRLFAVIPYFGYARQDRRGTEGEPVGLRVAADVLGPAQFDRLVVVDLHSASTEGCFPCPVEHLSAMPLLAEAARPFLDPRTVVVSPDLGAARLARDYGRRLGLPVALVHKTRIGGREVTVEDVAGEVRGRVPFLVDDMISTGGTIAAALDALVSRGTRPGAVVAATHGLLIAGSAERLLPPRVGRLLATDSVSPAEAPRAPFHCVSLAPLLADAIRRLHDDRSLTDLIPSRS